MEVKNESLCVRSHAQSVKSEEIDEFKSFVKSNRDSSDKNELVMPDLVEEEIDEARHQIAALRSELD